MTSSGQSRRTVIKPTGVPTPYPGFSPAVRFDNWVFVAGQLGSDFKSGLAPTARGNPAMPHVGEDIRIRECRYIYEQLARTYAAAGIKFEDSVRIDQFPTTRTIMDSYHVVRKELMPVPRPMSTSVHTGALLVPECQMAVELVAIHPQGDFTKKVVDTDKIPATIFGVSPALCVGDYVFVAAQVATDFKTGLAPEARRHPSFWEGSEIDLETRYMLKHFDTVLKAAGSSFGNVVKAFVYLSYMSDIPRLDRVWREAFPKDPPARTIIPCAGLGVVGTRIEVNFVALADNGKTKKEVVGGAGVRPALFHESPAIRAGNLLFLSGLMAADAGGLVPQARVNPKHPHVTDTATAQTEDILDQAEAICRAAGAKLPDAARMLSVLTDMGDFAASEAAWRKRFTAGEPATTAIAMPAPLAVPGATVLLDLWVGV